MASRVCAPERGHRQLRALALHDPMMAKGWPGFHALAARPAAGRIQWSGRLPGYGLTR